MNLFVVLSGKKLKRLAFLIVALLFTASIIMNEKENITVFSQQEPFAVYSVPTEKKRISLTFDISWGNERLGPILDVLEEKKVTQATFFLSAPWSKEEPELTKRIVEADFEIGSHGYKHTNYTALEDDEVRTQIRTAHAILNETTGKNPNLIRLPNGDFDQRVLRIANELNYTVIQWSIDSMDWKKIGADQIVEKVISNVEPGGIVFMHASDSSVHTHLALPKIIDELRSQGYEFVTVTDLLNQTDVKQKEITDSR